MIKYLKLPPWQMKDGNQGSHEENIGSDGFGNPVILTINNTTAEWQDQDFDWTNKVVKKRTDYPICWSVNSVLKYWRHYISTESQFVLFKPQADFSKANTCIRKPRCLIFCNYALQFGYSDVVNHFRDKFEKHNISVYKINNRWATFTQNGLPIASVEFEPPPHVGQNGREIGTLLGKEHFLGGEVMVVTDINRDLFLTYPNPDFHPYIFTDVDGINDCIQAFDKIKNYVFAISDEGTSPDDDPFLIQVKNATDLIPEYFDANLYEVAHTDIRNESAMYNLVKGDLFDKVEEFFGLEP